MPILDKMNQDNTPDDDDSSSEMSGDLPAKPQRKRPTPQFVESREGRRKVSVAALIERISDQFYAENTPDDSAIRATHSRTDRLKLLRPVVDYVVSVESIMLDDEGRAEVMRLAYSEIFGFGPLDTLIDDENITTITLEGAEKISVRRGHGDLEPVDIIFDDRSQLKDIVGRMLQRSGAILREDIPVLEVGCVADNGRFVSLSVVAPPAAMDLTLDIRLHPVKAPTLDNLLHRETINPKAAELLRALLHSDYGFTLVGHPESGKTMILSALLAELPNPERAVAVERTGELHLPEGMQRAVVRWPQSQTEDPLTFGQQIEARLAGGFDVMVLDEVRADEPHTIAPLLSMENPPRMIWSFRGAPESKRLISALGMLARRADVAQGELLVSQLFQRLPFVVSVRRFNEQIQLREVGEWYYPEGSEFITYRSLMQNSLGEIVTLGEKPAHPLPGLPDNFWDAE